MEMERGTRQTRQHLYLILDDYEFGYSFRKVDLFSDSPDWLVTGGIPWEGGTTLPPPFFRLSAMRGMPMHFATIGSKIVAMQPKEEGDNLDNGGACLDVLTRRFVFVPRHTSDHSPIYFHIGKKLFALGSFSFQSLDVQHLDGLLDGPTRQQWLWCDVLRPPISLINVLSHVVLPDEQTIFITFDISHLDPSASYTTYSFHVAYDGTSAWTCLGNWMLPFQGRGYFDPNINAWIGLAIHGEKRGHICCCQSEGPEQWKHDNGRDRKYSKEYLLCEDPSERHIGAILVSTGHKNKFCLVESIAIDYCKNEGDYNFKQEYTYFRYMFRLTTFSLEYDDNGDLTTGHSRRVRYFYSPKNQVTRFACEFPVAFYI